MAEPSFIPLVTPFAETASDRWLLVQHGKLVIVEVAPDTPRALTADEASTIRGAVRTPLLLGTATGQDGLWWTGDVDESFDLNSTGISGVALRDLRSLMPIMDADMWNIAGRATQICDWHRDHQFCGRCGASMRMSQTDRSLRCPKDGYTAYPRLSPAVIVLVINDANEALLAQNVAWTTTMYSTLAGFVEAGESLEDTIHREIFEEVGIRITDLEYFDSQPWPFPNSLMLGFFARFVSGDITPAPEEIADAQWFSKDALPDIAPPGSIARALIDDWLHRS